MEWLKQRVTRIIGLLLHQGGPRLIGYFLTRIDPTQLADAMRPHLRRLMEMAGPDWQAQFSTALRKIAEFVDELVNDPNTGI